VCHHPSYIALHYCCLPSSTSCRASAGVGVTALSIRSFVCNTLVVRHSIDLLCPLWHPWRLRTCLRWTCVGIFLIDVLRRPFCVAVWCAFGCNRLCRCCCLRCRFATTVCYSACWNLFIELYRVLLIPFVVSFVVPIAILLSIVASSCCQFRLRYSYQL